MAPSAKHVHCNSSSVVFVRKSWDEDRLLIVVILCTNTTIKNISPYYTSYYGELPHKPGVRQNVFQVHIEYMCRAICLTRKLAPMQTAAGAYRGTSPPHAPRTNSPLDTCPTEPYTLYKPQNAEVSRDAYCTETASNHIPALHRESNRRESHRVTLHRLLAQQGHFIPGDKRALPPVA